MFFIFSVFFFFFTILLQRINDILPGPEKKAVSFMHKPGLNPRGAASFRTYHEALSTRRTSTNIYRHSPVQRAQVPNALISTMKHLLLPIFALAAAVAGASSSGDLPPWMYVSTVTSDTYITVPCTGRPLPIDCEVNSWTDTTVTLTLTKGRTYIRFLCSVQLMLHNAYPSYSRFDSGRL